MTGNYWIKDFGPGQLPEEDFTREAEEFIRESLPEDYTISVDEEQLTEGEGILENSLERRLKLLDPSNEKAGSVKFVTYPEAGKFDFFFAETSGADQASYRAERAIEEVDERLEDVLDPELPDGEHLIVLNYNGRDGIIEDKSDAEDFQRTVRILEEEGLAGIDPRYQDRDLFYDGERVESGAFMIGRSPESVRNALEGTPIEIEEVERVESY